MSSISSSWGELSARCIAELLRGSESPLSASPVPPQPTSRRALRYSCPEVSKGQDRHPDCSKAHANDYGVSMGIRIAPPSVGSWGRLIVIGLAALSLQSAWREQPAPPLGPHALPAPPVAPAPAPPRPPATEAPDALPPLPATPAP